MKIMNKKLLFLTLMVAGGFCMPVCADDTITDVTPLVEEKESIIQDAVQDAPLLKEEVDLVESDKPLTAQAFVPVAALRIKEAIIEKSVILQELSFNLIDTHECLIKIDAKNKKIAAVKRQLERLCGFNANQFKVCTRAMAIQLTTIKKELSRQKNINGDVFIELDNEIHQLKVLAGDAMSRQKKLLIGTAITAAVGATAIYCGVLPAVIGAIAPTVATVAQEPQEQIAQNGSNSVEQQETGILPSSQDTSEPKTEDTGLGQNGNNIGVAQGSDTAAITDQQEPQQGQQNQENEEVKTPEKAKWVALIAAGSVLVAGSLYGLFQVGSQSVLNFLIDQFYINLP